MTSPDSDIMTAIHAVKQFNVPLSLPKRQSGVMLPSLKQPRMIEAVVFVVKNQYRRRYRISDFKALWGLVVGGDIEYTSGHYVEISWLNDGVRVKLKLVPTVIDVGRIVFRAHLSLYHDSKRLITHQPVNRVTFRQETDLQVPKEVLEFLENGEYRLTK